MGSCSSASQFKPCDKCMKSFAETTEEELMLKIAIIIGSTRPGRNGEAVGKWVYEIAQKRADAEFELVDIKDFNLPLLDEPAPPIMGQYSKPHTKAWAAKIGSFDAYVFVTPEYNHGISGALKNAIDFLFAEWNNNAPGFVSYACPGGGPDVRQRPVRSGRRLGRRPENAAGEIGLGRTCEFFNENRYGNWNRQFRRRNG